MISNMLTVWCDVCVYWCTAGQSRLREIFLKTDNVISGSYLAEITKEVSEGRLIDREICCYCCCMFLSFIVYMFITTS